MTLYSLNDLQRVFSFVDKDTPIDADIIVIGDSTSTGNGLRKLTFANFKTTLKAYWDTLYLRLDTTTQAIAGAKTFTGSFGYGTGSGGAVAQITSRTTGVTLNKTNGAITLFTAAGSATAASFTVTNTTVAATDVVHVSMKSGTNKYNVTVTATGAGSFEITFNTTGGTASDTPVINFAVIKAVIA